MAHLVDVLVHRRPGIDLAIDAVEAGAQHHRQRQVRVARRVGHAQLDPGGRPPGRGHADERAPIAGGPRDRRRGLVAGDEALERVDERVGDRAEPLGVAEQAVDHPLGAKGGGHVGLYIADDESCYHVLGGNQSNQVNIIRIAKDRLVAIRRPIYNIQPENVRRIEMAATGELSANEQ